MTDARDPTTGTTTIRPERKTGIWSLPPVVFATILALVIGVGYQLWLLTQPTYPLDLNSATEKHLMLLPGMDEATVQKIIAGRPYKRKDELVHKKILEPAQYDQIKEQVIAKRT